MKHSIHGGIQHQSLMRGNLLTAGLVLLSVMSAGCGVSSNPEQGSSESGQTLASSTAISSDPKVKGAELDVTRCAWPIHTDGRQSGFGFNDRNGAYEGVMVQTGLPGGHWRFRGVYPKARWISFESYGRDLASQAFVTGAKIDPDNPKSANPFAPGGTYQPGTTYKVDLIDTPPAQRDKNAHNILYGGYRMDTTYGGLMYAPVESVLYRVYAAPDDVSTLGGVPPPKMFWVVDDPKTNLFTSADLACDSVTASYFTYAPWPQIVTGLEAINDPLLKPFVVPFAQNLQGGPDPTNPPWVHIIRPSSNGYQNLWFNSATPYVGILTNKLVGPVLAVRFKAPTFTTIEDGHTVSGNEQVAYWDWCTTQFLTPLNYTIACRRDDQFTIDKDGYATLAISTEDERPVIDGKPYPDWIPMGGNGGISVMRLLSSNPRTFPQSPYFMPQISVAGINLPADIIPGITNEAQIKAQMGDYYPQALYCTKAEFEKDRCATAAPRPLATLVSPLTNAISSGSAPALPGAPQ